MAKHPRRSLLLLALCLFLAEITGAAEERPNILFLSIDDLRPQIGAYDESQMHTPNLDRLASQGRLFRRHYVQVATCGPSRACLLTGQNLRQQQQIGHHYLAKQLANQPERELPETFLHHFKRHGYVTVGMGKISHNENGRHDNKQTKQTGLELPHSWSEFLPVTPTENWGGSLLHGYASGESRETHDMPPFESIDLPDDRYPDGVLANMAVEKLAELAQQDQPFVLAVGFYKPHLPFVAPKKYWDLYQRKEIPLSPNPDAPRGVDNVFQHRSGEFFDQYKKQPEIGGAGIRLSDDYARQIIHANYAATSFVDAQVGKVLDQLQATGLDQNTIVVVWGDHGWHLGDHTLWGKHSAFDRALRSLMMVRVPDMPAAGEPTDALVAAIDIYPTLCELAGVEPPPGLDGDSFTAALDDPADPGKPFVMSFWRNILSLRTDRHRLALFRTKDKQRVMLFDHEQDPNESANLVAEQPAVAQRLIALIEENNHGYLPELN